MYSIGVNVGQRKPRSPVPSHDEHVITQDTQERTLIYTRPYRENIHLFEQHEIHELIKDHLLSLADFCLFSFNFIEIVNIFLFTFTGYC